MLFIFSGLLFFNTTSKSPTIDLVKQNNQWRTSNSSLSLLELYLGCLNRQMLLNKIINHQQKAFLWAQK